MLYVRQSSLHQVEHHHESRRLQYAMKQRLESLGWQEVEVVDDDLGRSGESSATRTGFQRMVAEVCLGDVGAVAAREISRFARNNKDWHQLVELCRMFDTLLIDQDVIYSEARHQIRRLQQVCDSHERAPLAEDNVLIGCRSVGPLRRHRASGFIIDAQ